MPVVVDPVRSRGGQKLIDLGCDIIICDDGLQHYALQRDLEVAVIDSARGLGNGWLMPMGPLREPGSRLETVDIQVINGQSMHLEPLDYQGVGHDKPLDATVVDAVAAIGNPQRFFDTLNTLGLEVIPHVFPDHHQYQADDFEDMKGPILMTEKDAVKCHHLADDRMYYLPVKTRLTDNVEKELQRLLKQLLN